jgi:hypothetical protein
MRPTRLPLPSRIPSITRPGSDRRQSDQKVSSEVKPPKKRSLNEAAHKLGH